MKAPVGRVAVFGGARRTERPRRHGCPRAIVRERTQDRIARAAVRTVDIWVPVPAFGGLAHLLQARVADRQVWRDTSAKATAATAVDDLEVAGRFRIGGQHVDTDN